MLPSGAVRRRNRRVSDVAVAVGAVIAGFAVGAAAAILAPEDDPPPAPAAVYHAPSIYPTVPPVTAPSAAIDATRHPVDPDVALVDDAVARVAAYGGRLTQPEMDAVLRLAGWPPDAIDAAAAVAWCESRYSPRAVGDGGSSLGVFQLWVGWFPWAGVDPDQWADPVTNAAVARMVWERDLRTWRQWSCRP